jgi:hypothetical protein
MKVNLLREQGKRHAPIREAGNIGLRGDACNSQAHAAVGGVPHGPFRTAAALIPLHQQQEP